MNTTLLFFFGNLSLPVSTVSSSQRELAKHAQEMHGHVCFTALPAHGHDCRAHVSEAAWAPFLSKEALTRKFKHKVRILKLPCNGFFDRTVDSSTSEESALFVVMKR